MPQIARCKDLILYRHSGSGGTKFARHGDELPESVKDGVWEPLAQDNIMATDTIPVFVQHESAIFRFNANFIPEEGRLINFRQVAVLQVFPSSGFFRITKVWIVNNDLYYISVARVGDMNPENLIFDLELREVGY